MIWDYVFTFLTSRVKSYNLTKKHLLYEKRNSINEHEHVLNKTYQADDATTVYRDIYLSHVQFLTLGGKIKTSSLLYTSQFVSTRYVLLKMLIIPTADRILICATFSSTIILEGLIFLKSTQI